MVSEVLVQRIHCHEPEARLNVPAGSITRANHHQTGGTGPSDFLQKPYKMTCQALSIWPFIHRIQSSLQLHEMGTEIEKWKQIPKVTQLTEENQISPVG